MRVTRRAVKLFRADKATFLSCPGHLDDGVPPPHIQATLTAQVQALDARLQDAVPALLALLDALPADDPFWQRDPVQWRVSILDALKRLLVRLSQTQPVVLVVEDLHWLDTRAMDRSAPVEAVSHLSRGLEVLATLPETLEHLQQELDLQVLLGAAWTQISGFATPALRQVYARARELGQRLGASQQLLAVLMGQFGGHLQRAELQTAQEVAIHLLMQVQGHRDPLPLLAAHTTLGIVLLARGEVVAAYRHLTQSMTLYVPTNHCTLVRHYGSDLGVIVRGNVAMSLWLLGAPQQALGHIHALHVLAQELSHPPSLAWALLLIARVTQWLRDAPATLRWTDALMACGAEHGFAQHVTWGKLLHGWALLAQGQREQGLTQIRQGLTAYDATQAAQWRPYFLALLAEGYGQTGAPDEGLRLLAEALVAVQHTDEHMWEAELHRLQGELLLQAQQQRPALADDLSHRAAAEASLRQVLAVARRQQAKSLELRAAMSLARFWQQQGKRAEAQALLAPVYGWFREGFETADLQEARTLLDTLR